MPKIDDLRQTLVSFVRGGRLSHAVLIEGEKGGGCTELALWLAGAIVCQGENPPCGKCIPCKKAAAGNHPDIEVIGGEGGAKSFHIDRIRELKGSLWLSPNEAEERIYVLLDIGEMTAEAQNALLKSLEEPPEHARFVMTCESRSMLLDTIVSRAAVYTLDALSPEECARELEKRFPNRGMRELELASLAFDGSVGAASAALEANGGMAASELALETFKLARQGNIYSLAAAVARVAPDKELFIEYLKRLKFICAKAAKNAFCGGGGILEGKVSAGAALKITEMIEKAEEAAAANCSAELLEAWFCGELTRAFGGNL